MRRLADAEDRDFDEAWQHFAAEEMRARAPADLERRIISAWHATPVGPEPRRGLSAWRRWLVAGGMAAAGIVWSLVWPTGPSRQPISRLGGDGRGAAHTDVQLPAPLLTLAAGPLGDTETIQIVRVRVPRLALVSAGILAASGGGDELVDVDLLVGDDGLARDIRGVRPVRE